MKTLGFRADGVCMIDLSGVPPPEEIETLVEDYVTNVELLPYELRLIFIDISHLEHMTFVSRQMFSELLKQASKHYGGGVEFVIAGGSLNLRRFLALLCKSIGLAERSHIFEDLKGAGSWVQEWGGAPEAVQSMQKEAS